jgi:hypothetical protein
MDGNNAVTDVTLADLLLLASSKGIVCRTSAKEKPTWQNFQCYTGVSSKVRFDPIVQSFRSGQEDNILGETA